MYDFSFFSNFTFSLFHHWTGGTCENVFSLIRSITTLKAYTYLIVMKGGLVAYYFPYEREFVFYVPLGSSFYFFFLLAFSVLIKIKLFWYVLCISQGALYIFVVVVRRESMLIEKPNNLNFKEHLKVSFYTTKTRMNKKKTRI